MDFVDSSIIEAGVKLDQPYPHVIVDGLFDTPILTESANAFPSLGDESFWDMASVKGVEEKFRSKVASIYEFPKTLQPIIEYLNSSVFLHQLQRIFGIHSIIPDPYFGGGGLNVTTVGGNLSTHIDGNYSDSLNAYRRLNVIVYCEPGWQENWGGHFGFYDKNDPAPIIEYAPLFNRLLAFVTDSNSWHGMSRSVRCPSGNSRKSIILYYYTTEMSTLEPDPQEVEFQPRSAIWRKHGFLDHRGNRVRKKYR